MKVYAGKPTTTQTDAIVLHMVVMGGGPIPSLIWANPRTAAADGNTDRKCLCSLQQTPGHVNKKALNFHPHRSERGWRRRGAPDGMYGDHEERARWARARSMAAAWRGDGLISFIILQTPVYSTMHVSRPGRGTAKTLTWPVGVDIYARVV